MSLKKGDRVKLITSIYEAAPSNPYWYSSYKDKGTVNKVFTKEFDSHQNMLINWDNGSCDLYSESNLALIEETECNSV